MSDARLSMNPEKRAKFDAMAREMVQGSIIEDAVTRFVSQVVAECAAAQAAEIERLTRERDEWRDKCQRNFETALGAETSCHEIAALLDAAEAERDALREVLADLLSWFPEHPEPSTWRLLAGERGADDAITRARAALGDQP